MKVVLENLTKRYPNRNKAIKEDVIAVNDFTFEIPDGKLIGLLGPSGCGKSTTLNMISGLEKPTSGKIYFGEDDVTKLPAEHRGIGLVFQNYALYPHLTVQQNIMFPLQNLKGKEKLSKKQMKEKALEAAKLVQIDGLMERKPSELSGGQQQRVAIARALVKMPRVLLLDEPLSNLDARLRLQTREEIRRIQQETGITTVFVTHDQEEAMSISDMIVVMKDGVVQQIGKPQDVYDSPKNLFVAKFLGTPPINVFHGCIIREKLYLGRCPVLATPGLEDKEYYVGVRPEAFYLNEEGNLRMKLLRVETQGRDTSVLSQHEFSKSGDIRSIISGNSRADTSAEEVRFDLEPSKVFLFDMKTEERFYYDLQFIKGKSMPLSDAEMRLMEINRLKAAGEEVDEAELAAARAAVDQEDQEEAEAEKIAAIAEIVSEAIESEDAAAEEMAEIALDEEAGEELVAEDAIVDVHVTEEEVEKAEAESEEAESEEAEAEEAEAEADEAAEENAEEAANEETEEVVNEEAEEVVNEEAKDVNEEN